MYGYLTNSHEYFPWDLPNPIAGNMIGTWTVLTNNTFILAQSEGEQSWSLITTELYKFGGAKGKVRRARKMFKSKFFLYLFL